ncbi:MAG: hypothetical protein P8H13_04045 [Polaribacter sp.]|nr:hypothetical protein [Polaribacter sp.]MDG1811096.1 hypothetical protein [Polaribacter sp.]MDG1993481.1 hypothetical protein [Polaribacter sp.]
MNPKKAIDCERSTIQKILIFRLPRYFRTLGIVLFAISFLCMFLKSSFPEHASVLKEGANRLMLVAMLFMSMAKDKEEDELTILLRGQSYAAAFILGVVYALVMPYIEYGVSNLVNTEAETFKELGDFQILLFMLMIQLMYYSVLKKIR